MRGAATIARMPRARSRVKWIREDRLPTLEEIEWLSSPEGRAVCAEMAAAGGAETPATVARWRQRIEPPRVAAAAQQVQLRKSARAKFSRADAMLFDRVGLEQATDEMIAAWKARRFAGFERVADLCSGIGGDAIALAGVTRLLALDWSELRLALTRHNCAVYDRSIDALAADIAINRPEADAVHIDPDRRSLGPRRRDVEAASPNLDELRRLVTHYRNASIKLSPGSDFDRLGVEAEIELISHDGECRQAVAWTGSLRTAHRRATVLPAGETIEASSDTLLDWPEPAVLSAGSLLWEPDPAVIRANLVGVLARRRDLAPIDPSVAWLVGPHAPATAMLRPFRIIDVQDWSLARARRWLAAHDVGALEIKTRGFAGRPEDIRRRLHLTGRQSCVLLLTRIGRRPVAILARRGESP